MSNDRALIEGDRLDSGMKASEAVIRAAYWWDRTGRHMAGLVSRADPVMAQFSGICAGHMWSMLKQREKAQVVKSWHHFFVRRPDLLDTAPDAKFKLGGEEQVR